MNDTIEMNLYPWLSSSWQRISQMLDSDRFPHAMLIQGASGLGKSELARYIAARLFCEQPRDHQPCGDCRGCTLFHTGAHPDFMRIEPEEDGKFIKVDMIRGLLDFTNLASQYQGYKVVIIEPAESMNRAAFNSLLKTLEEPATQMLLILVTSMPAALPATIKSRCQRIVVKKPDKNLAVNWLLQRRPEISEADILLSLADGSPLRALELHDNDLPAVREMLFSDLEALIHHQNDPVSVAANWHKIADKEPLFWLKIWLSDMVRLKQAPQSSHIANVDMKDRLQVLVNHLDLRSIYGFIDYLGESLRTASRISINPQLMLEDLLIRWSRIKSATQ